MGEFVNPGNDAFSVVSAGEYVDKTGLISLLNKRIGTNRNLVCVSRPRRFGKSYAAQMLSAYYDRSCDSSSLFGNMAVAEDSLFRKHLNCYDVIYVDISAVKPYSDNYRDLIPFLSEKLTEELTELYPGIKSNSTLPSVLVQAVTASETKIVMIIDEWDAPIRELRDDNRAQREYLEFLRSLFKNSSVTERVFAAVYMTGILPIKKEKSQSALSNFKEFTMVRPGEFAEYAGFTEQEVKTLCEKHRIDFASMKRWYDGYEAFGAGSIYNPNSVICAIEDRDFDSYWTETSSAEDLMEFITEDYSGLNRTIADLIGGNDVTVDVRGFSNDLTTFKGKNDVLTLLVHLGYLAYNREKKTVHIPNEEIRLEFNKSVREVDHEETKKRLRESEQLFLDTIRMNSPAVAAQIEKVHLEEFDPLHYNREDSLRCAIKLAYYTYRDHYLKFEELPSGAGCADIVYLPKQGVNCPVLLVELKWNRSAECAIAQIHDRNYPAVLAPYKGNILLVGVNYSKDAPPGQRHHECLIEKA